MGRRTLCSTPQSGGYNKSSGAYYGRHTHKQLSKSTDVELQVSKKSQVRSKNSNPDDDLLVRTVVEPEEASEMSDTCSATEVGGDQDQDGYTSHNAKASESQESILILMTNGQESGHGHGHHDAKHKVQKAKNVNGGIDRSRSSAGNTVTGAVVVMGGRDGTTVPGGNGTGNPIRTPTPAGMIMRTQEVTMTVETHGGGFDGRGGDMPAYPARTARW
ncbi:hypothetical protein N0V85_009529 [Neurospora sp. IMI 360204]|nr:hypothetical protein N0V85_009529 [Neurospora sp. IMI 360204]